MELTPEIVESARYEGRSYETKSGRKRWTRHEIWDDRLPGFGLRITSTNRKSFVVSYRAGGRKRTKVLGKAGDLTLEAARARAAELLETDAKDEPSTRAEADIQGVLTVAQLADLYLERHLKVNVPSWFGDQRLIRTHILPALGRVPVGEVTRGDRTSLVVRLGRRFPADARRLRSLLDGMFAWAEQHDLAAERPTRPADGRRDPPPAEPPVAEGEPEPPAEATPPPSPADLEQALADSEAQRQDLADRLDEVSASGAEMLSQINQQAARQRKLEAELATSSRELERVLAEARKRPDPEKTKKQVATLQASVGQLMDSLKAAERERDEANERLARSERQARSRSTQTAELRLERDRLESRLREVERAGGRSRARKPRPAVWLAAGAVAGILATLLLYQVLAPATDPPPASPASATDQLPPTSPAPATDQPPPIQTAPAPIAPAPITEPSRPGAAAPATDPPEGVAAPAGQVEPEPAPDPDLADAAVQAWATAWSEQRVDDYLAAYSPEFAPGDGTSRAEWAALRRQRIQGPASIQVAVSELSRTRLAADRVRVSFRQTYRTETYSDEVGKTLELVWEGDGWRIAAERAD